MHEAGDLDTSFGVDGQVLLEIIPGEDHFEPKMVLLPDDSILVAGGCGNAEMFCLARFKPDGTLDTSFGAPNGYVTTDIVSGEDDSPREVVVQPDGKILMIGDCIDAVQRICMVRYNENGTLDTSFGAPDGYVIFGYHPGDDDEGESLALQSNGQIIVAGECDFDNYICVSRRNSDGSEDATFNGGAGFTEINPSAGDDDEDPEVILQSDGKIVIAASCDDRDDVCVARFNADGTVDNSFGGAGVNWTRTPILGGFNYVEEVAITTGGRILVAGECNDVNYFCLLAYTSSGVLDTAFNGDGILLADVAPDWNAAYGLAVQADGKIILSGGCREGAHTCLLRVEADGDIDTDFGDDGWVIYKFTDEDDVGQDVIVQSDGKIIASSDCQDFTAFCLARFYGEDVPFSTGVTGGVYNFEGGSIIISAGAIPSGPDANANTCTLNISQVGHASLFNIQLDENVWDITIACDGQLVSLLLQPITICLVPKDGVTTGKQQYSRHGNETQWTPLPRVSAKAGMVCGTTSRLSLFIVGLPDYPLTGFAPDMVTDLGIQPAEAAYATTDMVLSIPNLDIATGIVGVPQSPNGWDVTWLGDQAGYLYGSAFPTWAGNTVITAHVWGADNQPGPFYGLNDLQHGDQITISAFGQTYTYEVRSNRLITPRGAAQFEHSEYDLLTLITCESFDPLSGDYRQRRVVTAVLISVD